eukprot:16126-Heterococcus_DN1.PRE.4
MQRCYSYNEEQQRTSSRYALVALLLSSVAAIHGILCEVSMFQKLPIDHSEVLPLSQCKQNVRSDHRRSFRLREFSADA